jgi:serine protease Do
MRRIHALATLAVISASALPAHTAAAQEARVLVRPEGRRMIMFDSDRPMIGVTTAPASERADTLGLRIEEVTEGSPAAEAGLKAGDRLQSINGVSLRAERADAGEEDYSGVLNRRLQREVQDAKEGQALELRVLSGGQARTVRVTPRKASEVMKGTVERSLVRSFSSDRPVLGLQVSSTGSARDTLGVFVTAVTKDGPAEKAGIIEGDRIAAINGVSLRVANEDAEDRAVGAARVERLQREVAKLEAGQATELTVVSGGRSRTVRVTAAKASELEDGESMFFSMPGGRVRVTPGEGSYRLSIPRGEVREFRGPGGEVRQFTLPRGEGRDPSMRLREFAPQMDELRRRFEVEVSPRARRWITG